MSNYTVMIATGLILGGRKVQVPGLQVTNFEDAPQLKMRREDGEPRDPDKRIRLIVLHTTTGRMPQRLKPGFGPVGDLAERNASYWATSKSGASAHLVVDHDGSWVQIADLLRDVTYHAGDKTVNHGSIGIEIAIGHDGTLYEGQMASLLAMLDFLTRQPEIPVPRQYATGPWPIPNIGRRFRGIIAHRDVGGRGEGDCGPVPYSTLALGGYDALDVSQENHTSLWKARQALLNQRLQALDASLPLLALDGDPGPATWEALRRFYKHGQWSQRPGD